MKRIFSFCALLAIFSTAALADIRIPDTPRPTPSPKEPQAIETQFYITIRKDAKEARLLIPKDQIKELRAQLDAIDGGANASASFGFARAQTIVGGLFLSLAFIAGGVWLTRSRRNGFTPNKTVTAGAVLLAGGVLATVAFANIGPPLDARSITGRLFTDSVHTYKQASGKIKVEISDENYGIRLIVPDTPRDKKAED